MERELTIVSGPLAGRLGETLRAALAGRALGLEGTPDRPYLRPLDEKDR